MGRPKREVKPHTLFLAAPSRLFRVPGRRPSRRSCRSIGVFPGQPVVGVLVDRIAGESAVKLPVIDEHPAEIAYECASKSGLLERDADRLRP